MKARVRTAWRRNGGRAGGAPLFFFLLWINAASGFGQQACGSTEPTDSVLRPTAMAPGTPITMLAFGTSVMWGNGLKQADTFRYRVADWVAAQTARPVQLTTYAHSGALLSQPEAGAAVEANLAPSIGDLNNAVPTVQGQIDCAANNEGYRRADLVLVEGCINDVGAESIVYPWTEADALGESTNRYCGDPFFSALQKIRQYFPKAVVVVAGYYPLVSSRSSIFGFSGTRRLASRTRKVYTSKHIVPVSQQKTRKPRREEHDVLAVNSEIFYQKSKASLLSAVNRANRDGESAVFFAQMPEPATFNGQQTMDPRLAYGSPRGNEWLVSFRFLHFWAFYKDENYWFRQPLCDRYVPADDIPSAINHLVCQTNPAFHPNVAGAAVYTKSIETIIPVSAISQWKLGGH